MLKRRERGRRLWFAVALVAALGLFAGGLAFAASETIVAGPAESYSQAAYNTDQGEVVQFRDDGDSHNVTARQTGPDGQALFRTPTLSGGTAGVAGTQYLSAGDYAFFCTVHPTTMSGTLHVTGNGMPQARPSATLSLRSKKISKATKKGLLVAISTTAKVDGVSLVAKLGKAVIGKADGLSLSAGQQFAVLKLTKAGKAKLSKKSAASVTLIATIPFAAPATAKVKLT